MAITHKDINLLTQKATIAGTEKIPVSDTEYVTTTQIASLGGGGGSETDPTVPSWAKAATKPTYTASEVGALPSSTSIPDSLSDLSEDSTHRVVTDTEKSTWNGKQNAITISSSEPTSGDGSNGDIWIVV